MRSEAASEFGIRNSGTFFLAFSFLFFSFFLGGGAGNETMELYLGFNCWVAGGKGIGGGGRATEVVLFQGDVESHFEECKYDEHIRGAPWGHKQPRCRGPLQYLHHRGALQWNYCPALRGKVDWKVGPVLIRSLLNVAWKLMVPVHKVKESTQKSCPGKGVPLH
ncbi:unnamed protein product [Ostreobium quekettii]|uniref:Uncharacterized protein n=1 Tax=Ostreobium quekettii TaxID=121088 RepID=A0A8S1IR75_9CHLO|nr:unnamed protein product [Ostreobium quekettii]